MLGAAQKLQQLLFSQLLGQLLQEVSLWGCCRMLDHDGGPLQATVHFWEHTKGAAALYSAAWACSYLDKP